MDSSNLNLIYDSLPLLTQGAWMTLQVLFAASCISLGLGILAGIFTCNRLRSKMIAPFIEVITFILRAVPFYVQLLIVYFVLPDLLKINMEAFTASIITLGVCSAAYITQIVRCGINSIPIEQWESAATLGYSTQACVRYIIFPQMLRNVLPAITNELESLLKSTAILSSIGLLELTRMGMNIVSREMEPLAIYLTIAVFYVIISAGINRISKHIEQRFCYANG